jgi:hypothetical protein
MICDVYPNYAVFARRRFDVCQVDCNEWTKERGPVMKLETRTRAILRHCTSTNRISSVIAKPKSLTQLIRKPAFRHYCEPF